MGFHICSKIDISVAGLGQVSQFSPTKAWGDHMNTDKLRNWAVLDFSDWVS